MPTTEVATLPAPKLPDAPAGEFSAHDLVQRAFDETDGTTSEMTVLSVGASKRTDGSFVFRATAHWDGFSRTGDACEFGYGEAIAEALADLFKSVALLRTPPEAIADEPLPVEG